MTTKEKTVILSASNSRDQVSWVRLLQAQKKLNSQMEKKIFYKPQLPSTSSLTHSLKSRTQECSFKEGHKRLSSGINAEYGNNEYVTPICRVTLVTVTRTLASSNGCVHVFYSLAACF
eukprot:TRINITY_DN7933_c0_g1_i2.p1 TRINITY_DN7933_c0_g1~~TRINITY_DN7933_c0_g1_i2.p1  ORF type:complete len:129 (-),score=13.54 TRINITY_DN7933_c0_g1_i2:1322-1675(-)